jgi:Ca2+-binding EF-hand superfamily protein
MSDKGQLNDCEIAQVREIFCVIDRSHNNYLGIEDVKILLHLMGISANVNECKAMCAEQCADSEKASFEEVIKMLELYGADLDRVKPFQLAFRLLNKSESGEVDADDVMRVLKVLGEHDVTKENAEKLIRDTSLFGYDKINFVDFIIALMKN